MVYQVVLPAGRQGKLDCYLAANYKSRVSTTWYTIMLISIIVY